MPIKTRPRIGFSTRGNITVPDNRCGLNVRVSLSASFHERLERDVLHFAVNMGIGPLKFNANTEIIALRKTAPTRYAGVPGILSCGHKLYDLTVASNEEVRRYIKVGDLCEVLVCLRIKLIGK
jgi:hypothetical protein